MSCRIGGIVGPKNGTDAASLLDAASRALSNSQTANVSVGLVSDPATPLSSPSSQTDIGRMRHYVGARHGARCEQSQ